MNRDFKNVSNAVNSLIDNGFQVTIANYTAQQVTAVDNEGNIIQVFIGPAGYCKVVNNGFICTNMSQPYQVGECARLRRHVGMFETNPKV